MDLLRSYSNQAHQVDRFHKLLAIPKTGRPERIAKRPKQEQRRLNSDQRARLLAAYGAGKSIKALATKFEIRRLTVRDILQREGVPIRRPVLREADALEAARLYQNSWSLDLVGTRFGVASGTVANTVRRLGVTIRPRRGWPPLESANSS